ncbi:MAG: GNAT family N-acetyltransferase [Gemmatimonadaceae bacterium]
MSDNALDIRENRDAHRYEVAVGDELAVSAYELTNDTITLTHTEVPEAAEGHGVGAALVRFALDDARKRGLRVVPLCPFVKIWIKRHPEYHDIVHPSWRLAVSA